MVSEALLAGCAKEAAIDLTADRLGAGLMQMFVVANVVRHGEGQSCDRLRALAPELWDDDASDIAGQHFASLFGHVHG